MSSVYQETESESSSLKAKDLGDGDVLLTIQATSLKEFDEKSDDGDEYKKKRIVLAFSETDKTMVLNATNLDMVVLHHGEDRSQWPGKTITLYCATTKFRGDTVPCIRIRPPVSGAHVSRGLPGSAPPPQETVADAEAHPFAPGNDY